MTITANQITITRILLLPIPAALLLEGSDRSFFLALIIGAVLGATDFIDGYMARRDGPTKLGGLLDPVADKMFMAAFLLPLAARGDCPSWVVAGIFLRELLISALRSSLAEKNESLKTSSLGKLKTVVQMGGLMVFYFTAKVSDDIMFWAYAAGLTILWGWFLYDLLLKKRKPVFWVLGTAPLWTILTLVYMLKGREVTVFVIFLMMIVLTWVSAFDYLTGAIKVFKNKKIKSTDVLRILYSFFYGALLILILDNYRGLVIPLLISLSAALALIGIDNIVCDELRKPSYKTLWKSGFIIPMLFFLIVYFIPMNSEIRLYSSYLVTLIQIVYMGIAFYLEKEIFKNAV